jgi:hypothetical protein
MALPSVGGGYQFNDGNLNELKVTVSAAPATAAGDATLTVAQLTNGLILGSPGTSAAAYTLPLAADLDAALTNAKVGTTFDFSVINVDGSSSGVITMTTNTGWAIGTSGSQGLMTVAATAGTVRRFRARRTGDAAWALYAIS